MMLARPPFPALKPFVQLMWATEGTEAAGLGGLERILPTGAMHLVFRLSGGPVHLVEGGRTRAVGHTLLGGARASHYVREVPPPGESVGVQFQPGAAPLLLGVPAHTLADQHTPLDDVWGREVEAVRQRLRAERSAAARLEFMERLLLARLQRSQAAVHPAVELALRRFAMGHGVTDVVEATGYSHRRFIVLFREAVGLTPKVYTRVVRFQGALSRLAGQPQVPWSELALDAGYTDQPHLHRDFVEFTGLSPGQYRALRPRNANHVPIPLAVADGRSNPSKT